MNKKTDTLMWGLFTLMLLISVEMVYLSSTKSTYQEKELFVKTVGLPDLAISTESYFIRHRSLQDISSIFFDGPEHLEYFPSTFAINHNMEQK